ncbi:TetR/AcrR family transcriptional regulator [Microbacterium protaetiae]|uniref:TetR/AcrR family transcriptional regulator n=1 Tax=Microbacterium protaetiae TaxID=2509458 RepID=A0A4P6EEI1_9MICO|nr:TetR/AcrR family transcriptional regulator [Microbacterium protaetiae]QAY60186.1 TetR/AcrR family transcriptional regulator [Microbacterium protaetiae]
MRTGPYHHGNLRAELLASAGRTLREQGPDQISLRELAREAGVSKSAPNRHFRDKQALLVALAVAGFERLNDEIVRAIADAGAPDIANAGAPDIADAGARAIPDARAGAGSDVTDRYVDDLRATAAAFVDFAVRETALLDLMFSLAKTSGVDDVAAAAEHLFATIGELIDRGQASGALRAGDPTRLTLLISAMFQGIAVLASGRRVSAAQTAALLDDAVGLFLADR